MDSANSDPAVSRSQQKQTLNIVSVNVIDSELSKNDQRICNKKANEIKKNQNKKNGKGDRALECAIYGTKLF